MRCRDHRHCRRHCLRESTSPCNRESLDAVATVAMLEPHSSPMTRAAEILHNEVHSQRSRYPVHSRNLRCQDHRRCRDRRSRTRTCRCMPPAVAMVAARPTPKATTLRCEVHSQRNRCPARSQSKRCQDHHHCRGHRSRTRTCWCSQLRTKASRRESRPATARAP